MWSAAELEAILDALPARVSWWDDRLRMRYANSAATTGEPRARMLGWHIEAFLGPSWLEDHAELLAAVRAGEHQQFDRVWESDGTEQVSQVRLCPVADRGFVVFSVDSTAMARQQEEALRNNARSAVLGERQRIAAHLGELVIDATTTAKAELRAGQTHAAGLRLDDVMVSLRSTIRSLREPPRPEPAAPQATVSTRLLKSEDHQPHRGLDASGLDADDLRIVLDSLPVAVTAWDTGFHNTFANEAAVAAFDFGSAAAVHGRYSPDVVGETQFNASLRYGEAAMAGHPQQFIRTLPAPGGGTRSGQVDYVAHLVDGELVGVIALVLDVTERVAADESARASEERLMVLRDRARIAEDLHDLVIQRLFAAGLIATAPGGDAPSAIATATDCIDDAVAELRHSVHELHGEGDSTFRLELAIERVARQATRSLGFSPTTRWEGGPRDLPTEIAVDIVAVVSEALSNAARHAGASRVDVHIGIAPHAVSVRVADDGIGMPPAAARRSGLANLRARAERHSGTFQHLANSPRGTVVEWSSPVG